MDAQLNFTLEQLGDTSVADFFRLVLKKNSPLQVFMPDGKTVIIHPEPQLIPLPKLEGTVSKGWKDAIYAP